MPNCLLLAPRLLSTGEMETPHSEATLAVSFLLVTECNSCTAEAQHDQRYLWVLQGTCCIPTVNSVTGGNVDGLQIQIFRSYNSMESFSGTWDISAHHFGWHHLDIPGAGVSVSVKRIAPAWPQSWEIYCAICKLSRKVLPVGSAWLLETPTPTCRDL